MGCFNRLMFVLMICIGIFSGMVIFPENLRAELRVIDSTQAITLQASTCEELGPAIDAIVQWATRLGDKAIGPRPIPELTTSGKACRVVVDSIVPDYVRKYNGTRAVVDDGINCWNTSLVLAKLLPSFRNTTSEEMQFWMNSPLCRQLSALEPPQAGDVITIREARTSDLSYNEIHGLIYVGGGLVFSKNGASASQPFALQTQQDVYDTYSVGNLNPQCEKSEGTPQDCLGFTNYYRCMTIDEYVQGLKNGIIKSTSENVPTAYFKVDACMKQIEGQLTEDLMGGEVLTQEARYFLRTVLEVLEAQANGELVKNPGEFLWVSVLTRIGALKRQI